MQQGVCLPGTEKSRVEEGTLEVGVASQKARGSRGEHAYICIIGGWCLHRCQMPSADRNGWLLVAQSLMRCVHAMWPLSAACVGVMATLVVESLLL